MKTKILLIALIASLTGCIPANMNTPYFKVCKIESEKKGLSRYELTGDGTNVSYITIDDVDGKYKVGDSLMLVLKTKTDSIK